MKMFSVLGFLALACLSSPAMANEMDKASAYQDNLNPASGPVIIRSDTYVKWLISDFEKVKSLDGNLGIISHDDLRINYLKNGLVRNKIPISWDNLEAAIYNSPVRKDGESIHQLINNFYVFDEPKIRNKYHLHYFACVGDMDGRSYLDKQSDEGNMFITEADEVDATQSQGILMCVDGESIDGKPCDEEITRKANQKRDYSNLGACKTFGLTRYGHAAGSDLIINPRFTEIFGGRLDKVEFSEENAEKLGLLKTPLNPLITQENVQDMQSNTLSFEPISDTPQSRYLAAALIDAGVEPNHCSFSPLMMLDERIIALRLHSESDMSNRGVVSMLNVYLYMSQGRMKDVMATEISERIGIYGLCDTAALEGIAF